MASLSMSTALITVEVALKNAILLALGQRIAPLGHTSFADAAALRTQPQAMIRNDELAFVAAKGVTYQFDRFNTASDDGDLVIAPLDAAPAGRWLKTASTVGSGYAKQVRIHTGAEEWQNMLAKGNAVRPSIHILFDTVNAFERSLSKGALYQMAARYRIMCIGSNLRSQAQSSEGSEIATETDPGSHQMVGDVIATVAGQNFGVNGITYCEIEQDRFFESPEGGRLFVEQLGIVIFYTVHQPDTDAVTLDALSGITVQRELLGGGSAYDASNVVTSGYTVTVGSGLTKTPAAGTAVVNSIVVASSPGSVTFAANSDTYRDLHTDGSFTYTAVANGRPAPPLAYTGAIANTLRVGVTVTDGAGVIYDAMLGATLVPYRAPDIVPAAGWAIASIAVTPSSASIAAGQTQQFTATATYTDGRTRNISTVVTWQSSNPSAAAINYAGVASWVGTGSTTISCSYDGIAGGNTAALTTT